MQNKTVLLTGAKGFLGSHILTALIEKEYKWSRNQRDKLKKFFGIESDMETNHKWKETTHAYSYFVTKTDLLDHILDNMNYVSAINKCKYEYNLSLRMTINDAKNYKIT